MGYMGAMDPRGMWGTWELWGTRGMWGTWERWTLGVCGAHGRDGP